MCVVTTIPVCIIILQIDVDQSNIHFCMHVYTPRLLTANVSDSHTCTEYIRLHLCLEPEKRSASTYNIFSSHPIVVSVVCPLPTTSTMTTVAGRPKRGQTGGVPARAHK